MHIEALCALQELMCTLPTYMLWPSSRATPSHANSGDQQIESDTFHSKESDMNCGQYDMQDDC